MSDNNLTKWIKQHELNTAKEHYDYYSLDIHAKRHGGIS